MLEFLRKLFTNMSEPDYAALRKAGAVIIDVRTQSEYKRGHIDDSVNIPLDMLKQSLHRLPSDKRTPLIVCCVSDVRSGQAQSLLTRAGYQQAFNGGSWTSLNKKLHN